MMLSYILAFGLKTIGQTVYAVYPSVIKRPAPEYTGQAANDYIRQRIETATDGLMISKFGTYELKAFVNFYGRSVGLRRRDVNNLLHYRYVLFRSPKHTLRRLCHNAGFFPENVKLGLRYAKMVAADWREMDILGSYQKEEAYPLSLETNKDVVRVDLEGYYAPMLWENPWSKALKGKRVLVVHPFIDSIRRQYEHHMNLFADSDVLPSFAELLTLQAVQGIAGQPTGFNDWFEALDFMKQEMDKMDYDIALIGCGAYGMHLAAHAKRRGKVGIHLAGMTQMLFGIYGERWARDERYRPYILSSWVRPLPEETPVEAQTVENGCYW